MNTSTQPSISSIDIIYEDELMVVVNKPNNFLIHQSHYARNIQEPTLLDFLHTQLNTKLYPVHRLDRKTSGILLLLKDKSAVADFQALFTSNAITKTYYAITRGFAPPTGSIDFPVKNDDTGVYKEALTHYQTINNIVLDIPVHPYSTSRYSLVQLTPKTGRMHQLRKHLNKVSHPIVGDYKYGDRFHNRMFEREFNCHYLFLHAYRLQFKHPLTGLEHTFTAPFPKDWEMLFKRFNWELPQR